MGSRGLENVAQCVGLFVMVFSSPESRAILEDLLGEPCLRDEPDMPFTTHYEQANWVTSFSELQPETHEMASPAELQPEIKCCGYNSYNDFTGSPYVNKNSLYPQFCCSPASVQCVEGTAASQSVHGCLDAVVNLLKDNIASVVGVAICVIVIEVAAMVVSMILYKR
ncbi:tetraspanin-1-like [Ictalurus furcatus]|uniref:tetraspanin-1-like n=1 Tax=Ictalurus furcatus TaxID=66913 RepID=UPI002350652C|nr:tetraspanin-1-like [Ictalurus furcatus]